MKKHIRFYRICITFQGKRRTMLLIVHSVAKIIVPVFDSWSGYRVSWVKNPSMQYCSHRIQPYICSLKQLVHFKSSLNIALSVVCDKDVLVDNLMLRDLGSYSIIFVLLRLISVAMVMLFGLLTLRDNIYDCDHSCISRYVGLLYSHTTQHIFCFLGIRPYMTLH
jgi:hypothetical protein